MNQQHKTSLLGRKASIMLFFLSVAFTILPSPGTYAITKPEANGVAKDPAFTIMPPWAAGKAFKIIGGYGPNAGSTDHKNVPGKPQDYFALDFNLPVGTDVYPVAAGTVIFAQRTIGNYAGYGNLVFIDHGNGYQSAYAHLKSIAVTVKQQVTTSTKLGQSGRTGLEANQLDHLHFALYQDAHIVTDFSTDPDGKAPGKGFSVVPEPFQGCFKNTEASACEDLLRKHILYRPLLQYQSAGAYNVGSDCRSPDTPAQPNWRWRISGIPNGFTPARMTDSIGGIWQDPRFYPCVAPWRWVLVSQQVAGSDSNGATTWDVTFTGWQSATPNPSLPYTLELRDANGRSFTVLVTW